MDVPSPQPWGVGLVPRLIIPPPSFIVFFPARSHDKSLSPGVRTGTPGYVRCGQSQAQTNAFWITSLAAPRPIRRAPAWHRVPTEALSVKNGIESSRVIMKRIIHPEPPIVSPSWLNMPAPTKPLTGKNDKQSHSDALDLPNTKIPRLDSWQRLEGSVEFSGKPMSAAEVLNLLMQAKVDIVNGLLPIPDEVLLREMRDLVTLSSGHGHMIPMKRGIDKYGRIAADGIYGAHRLASYEQITNIYANAKFKRDILGHCTIDLAAASYADSSSRLRELTSRDVRFSSSRIGASVLPPIVDEIEPAKGELDIMATPDPSPSLQRTSQPGLLFVESIPSPCLSAVSGRSPLTGDLPLDSATVRDEFRIAQADESFGAVPSPSLRPTSSTSTPRSSPMLATLPFDPPSTPALATASQRSPAETKTSKTSPPDVAASRELGLVASIPSSASRSASPALILPRDLSEIKFANTSPSFISPSWLGRHASPGSKPWSTKSRRRFSEPFVRSFLNTNLIRRRSSSPKKTLPPVAMASSPETPNFPSDLMTPAVSRAKLTGRVSGSGTPSSTPRRAHHGQAIHNVDMRETRDIFGATSVVEAEPFSGHDVQPSSWDNEHVSSPSVMSTDMQSPPTRSPQAVTLEDAETSSVPMEQPPCPLLVMPAAQVERHTSPSRQPSPLKTYDDTPERDYMRDFIKRSGVRKRLATDDGSPIAPPAKRLPLGAKSTNTPSPQKLKRKAEGHEEVCHDTDVDKPWMQQQQPPHKKICHDSRSSSLPSTTEGDATECVKEQDTAEGMVSGPNGERRSTRLRAQRPSAIPKPALAPTAIRFKPAVRRNGLAPSSKGEQQDVCHQTRLNTRRNKGNAEYPAQVLARRQAELSQPPPGIDAVNAKAAAGKSTAGAKNVVWKTPLEVHGDVGSKRTGPRVKTYGGIKPPTPAKPKRMTRSSARVKT